MKLCLFIVTSTDRLRASPQRTGLWLSGLTHPYFELMQAGFEADIASPLGGPVPIDPYSHPLTSESVTQDDIVSHGFLSAPQHASALQSTLKLEDVDVRRYRAVILCGGNGALFDLKGHPEVQRILSTAWRTGRIVASISQGLAGLLEVDVDGHPLLAGQTVTGLSREERIIAERLVGEEYYPYYFEDEVPKIPDARLETQNAYTTHVQVSGDGRLITAQNHASAKGFGRRLVEALTGAPVPSEQSEAPQYQPNSGLLGALNQHFHQDYEELVELTILSLEQMHTPVIILMGDKLILRRDGRRDVAVVIPPIYHRLKAIGHTLFGVYLSLEVRRPNGINASERARLAEQHHLIDATLDHLRSEGLPDEIVDAQVDLLEAARELLARVIATGQIEEAQVHRFAREMGRRMGDNNMRAQRAELDGLHAQVITWLEQMPKQARDQLYVVICGTHQSRYQDIALVYFTELLGEVVGPGAFGEDRLLYAEGSWDEANALDLVARHIIDQDAGEAFFEDRMRMQRDLLSDGAQAYVTSLLADCAFYGSKPRIAASS